MIVILGPAPQDCANTGVYLRVMGLDSLFSNEIRLYLNFKENPLGFYYDDPFLENPKLKRLVLNPKNSEHRKIIYDQLSSAHLIYSHSIFYIEPIVELLNDPNIASKLVVDLHGVVPEEALLSGNTAEADKFSTIEKAAVEKSALLVMVSKKMQKHFHSKYKNIPFKSEVMPVFLQDPTYCAPSPSINTNKPVVIYAGGIEKWQNIDLMLDGAASVIDHYDFRFFSFCQPEFLHELQTRGIKHRVKFGIAINSQIMKTQLEAAQYGFVLRSDSVVNQVACPTKLIEYLHRGLIPIVLSASIGDFAELGYQFITLDDFLKVKLPTEIQRIDMVQKNLAVARQLREQVEFSFKQILKIKNETNSKLTEDRQKILVQGKKLISFEGKLARMTQEHESKLSVTIQDYETELARLRKGVLYGIRRTASRLKEWVC